ncbi:MAG TPA: hypothetical protein VF985_08560 [Mariniflexile sp.]
MYIFQIAADSISLITPGGEVNWWMIFGILIGIWELIAYKIPSVKKYRILGFFMSILKTVIAKKKLNPGKQPGVDKKAKG